MENFNPNDVGVANGNFFGLPYTLNEAEIVLLPVPWDATVSYGAGTSQGPQAIIDASVQVDLFDEFVSNAWETKISTVQISDEIENLNSTCRKSAEDVIQALEQGKACDEKDLDEVNKGSNIVNEYVKTQSLQYLKQGKIVGVVGGEHSVPYGLIKSLSGLNEEFGILHIDAHADLRCAYERFEYSHASIMYNVLKNIPQVSKLTQVAIRDFCNDEFDIITNDDRVNSFTDKVLSKYKFKGESWDSVCDKIISTLPKKVYISFDIDGLSPDLCPNTGTPVPGGLSYSEANYLLEKLVKSGRKIIGFDLCEVGVSNDIDSEWDANVGARILFRLCQLVKYSK